LIDGRRTEIHEQPARYEWHHRDRSVAAAMVRRQPKHDRRPPFDERVEDFLGGFGVDAAVGEHRDTTSVGHQIGSSRTFGNEARQRCIARIPGTAGIEIDDEGSAGRSGESQGPDGAEHPVERRPDGNDGHAPSSR